MKKFFIYIISCIVFTSPLFSIDQMKLLNCQFKSRNINDNLKKNIPFLQQHGNDMNFNNLTSENIFTLKLQLKESDHTVLSEIIGLSMLKIQFSVSWYIFTNELQIPNSTHDVMRLLNTQKPLFFSILTYMNGVWKTQADLSYLTENNENYIYTYISFPNADGVLVPLASQSFYRDTISGLVKKEQSTFLNLELLDYWDNQGYL